MGEVRKARQDLIKKTLEAVNDRLTKEIAYWDLRAEVLKGSGAGWPDQRPPQFHPGPPPGRPTAGTA